MNDSTDLSASLARSFQHLVSVRKVVADRLRQRIGLRLLKRSLPVFVCGGDIIALDPLVNGHHEPVLNAFLTYLAHEGYGGFFIDIGANIGLTSCQNGDLFREVIMFEPNPEIFPILQLNTRLALASCHHRAFNFGLGPVSSKATLNIPARNIGGAFIHDSHNAYSDELFASRFFHDRLEVSRFRQIEIQIMAAREVFPDLFAELRRSGCTAGVLKVDVEGYERAILESMAPWLPSDFKVFVVFENWNSQLDLRALLVSFGRPVKAYRFSRRPSTKHNLRRTLPSMLLGGGARFGLEPVQDGDCEGDIVLAVG
jgi:FkbM family methyltransferase